MYSFKAFGHENITAEHKTTLELTKEAFLTKKGDCIVGICADFSLSEIKKAFKESNKIKIILKTKNHEEEIKAVFNPGFNSDKEMVIRKSDFSDERTFAVKADKASCDLNRRMVDELKNGCKINILIKEIS